jgi:hypothetical protein
MTRLRTTTALVLGLCVGPAQAADGPATRAEKAPLRLTIRLDRDAYKAGDRVALRFELRNESQAPLYVGDGFLAPGAHEVGPHRHFELSASDADGARLRFWSAALSEGHAAGARRVFRVAPGESYRGEVVLSAGSFATLTTDRKHALGVDGRKYTLALRYEVNDNFGVHEPPTGFKKELLWKGALQSNEVSLVFE